MYFANGRCLLCIAFLVLFAALLILAVVHRVRAKKKVLALTPGERVRLLNELAEPFGFAYLPAEDIFTSRLDAWQRACVRQALPNRSTENAQKGI